MRIVIFIISLLILIKNISYGIYEIKSNENKFGGIFVIVFAVFSSTLPNLAVYIRGI